MGHYEYGLGASVSFFSIHRAARCCSAACQNSYAGTGAVGRKALVAASLWGAAAHAGEGFLQCPRGCCWQEQRIGPAGVCWVVWPKQRVWVYSVHPPVPGTRPDASVVLAVCCLMCRGLDAQSIPLRLGSCGSKYFRHFLALHAE